jgi:hypothetical protein
LLLDEVDSYLPQADELRGLLNAGHKRGACAYRCEGENNAVRAFKAFAPAVLSGIGDLPGTLQDRSVTIVLLQAEPEDLECRFDSLHTEIESVLCRKLARWAQDHFAILQACEPPMPPNAFNRLADNWRPLLAIAQAAGGDWPDRALEAFDHLTNRRSLPAEALPQSQILTQKSQIELLADIRQIFTESGSTRLSCRQLVSGLQALARTGTPAKACRAQLTPILLGRHLQGVGIRAHSVRIGLQAVKGYALADFDEAFLRLPKENVTCDFL